MIARDRLVADTRTNSDPKTPNAVPPGSSSAWSRTSSAADDISIASAKRSLADSPTQTDIMIRIGTTEVKSWAPSAMARSKASSRRKPATVASTTRPAQREVTQSASRRSRSRRRDSVTITLPQLGHRRCQPEEPFSSELAAGNRTVRPPSGRR